MGLTCTVGGARGTFTQTIAEEVADLIDQAFGSEGDWEAGERRTFGELDGSNWSEFQERAIAAVGVEELANVLAVDRAGRGVYLPANVRAVSLTLGSGGAPLHCASLTGLRRELFRLAECWGLPVDEDELSALLENHEDGGLADAPEALMVARLMLAANEAMRRDCPLWLVG